MEVVFALIVIWIYASDPLLGLWQWFSNEYKYSKKH